MEPLKFIRGEQEYERTGYSADHWVSGVFLGTETGPARTKGIVEGLNRVLETLVPFDIDFDYCSIEGAHWGSCLVGRTVIDIRVDGFTRADIDRLVEGIESLCPFDCEGEHMHPVVWVRRGKRRGMRMGQPSPDAQWVSLLIMAGAPHEELDELHPVSPGDDKMWRTA